MDIKLKKISEDAVIPSYAKKGDAGLDLTATSVHLYDYEKKCKTDYITYSIGLSLEIPEGYVGLIYPRSSISKMDLILCNHVAVIDSGFRSEITLRFKPTYQDWWIDGIDKNNRLIAKAWAVDENGNQYAKTLNIYSYLERVAQLIITPYPQVKFIEMDELSQSERNLGGFGSTGK